MTHKNVALKEIIVLNGVASDAMLRQLAAETGRTVVSLTDGQALESLDEAQMRAAGWVRA